MKPLSARSTAGLQMTTSLPQSQPTAKPASRGDLGVTTSVPVTPTSKKTPTGTPVVDHVDQGAPTATVAKQAGVDGVPTWATADYFTSLANGGGAPAGEASSGLKGGGGLQVRLAAMQAPKKTSTTTSTPSPAELEARRERGRGLLGRALHDVGVIAGRPMTAAEIAEAPPALHLTRPSAVQSILESGLRPTTGLYKNLTTWFRDAVYMFGREPTAYQKFLNFSSSAGEATATIEIDLKKLDPDKLYKRVLDGAIIYVSNTPIPKEALRLREAAP